MTTTKADIGELLQVRGLKHVDIYSRLSILCFSHSADMDSKWNMSVTSMFVSYNNIFGKILEEVSVIAERFLESLEDCVTAPGFGRVRCAYIHIKDG
jgi:hypothetical protein